MKRERLGALLADIRALHEQALAELSDLTEAEFDCPTSLERWDDIRRVLLRFGDHVREHATQVEAARAAIGRVPTTPQRMLAEAEIAWGKLLASTVGLVDDDITLPHPDGGWSVMEVLEHVLRSERRYLQAIRQARTDRAPTGSDHA